MPIKKAAFKHLRQTRVRTARNQAIRRNLQNVIKTTRRAIEAGDTTQSKAALAKAVKTIDKATRQGILKPNTAARRKSRLMRRINALATRLDSPAKREGETKK